jgi:hypothetical protein
MRIEYEFLCLIHELVEWFLCLMRGIKEPVVMAFDLAHLDHPDPGRLPEAPYHREHMFAMRIERLLCKELGLDWQDYDKSFDKLIWRKRK